MARLMPTPPIGDIACARRRCTAGPGDTIVVGDRPRRIRSLTWSPVLQLVHTFAQERRDLRDVVAECWASRAAEFRRMPALGDDVGALPVVAAIEHDEDSAGIETTKGLRGSSGFRERRIHKTSIGAPRSIDFHPCFRRERWSGAHPRRRPGLAWTSSGPRGVLARTPARARLLNKLEGLRLHPRRKPGSAEPLRR